MGSRQGKQETTAGANSWLPGPAVTSITLPKPDAPVIAGQSLRRPALVVLMAARFAHERAFPAVCSADPLSRPAALDGRRRDPGRESNTVIGPNVMLADGAEALMRGDWQRGIQLTQMGLTFAVTQQDRASASRIYAGFAALKQYQRALEHCDQSIELVRTTGGRGRTARPRIWGWARSKSRCATFSAGCSSTRIRIRCRRRSRSRAVRKKPSRSA